MENGQSALSGTGMHKNGVMEIQKEKTDEYFIFFNAKE